MYIKTRHFISKYFWTLCTVLLTITIQNLNYNKILSSLFTLQIQFTMNKSTYLVDQ